MEEVGKFLKKERKIEKIEKIGKLCVVYGGLTSAIQNGFRLRRRDWAGLCSIGRRGRLRSTRTSTLRNASVPLSFLCVLCVLCG